VTNSEIGHRALKLGSADASPSPTAIAAPYDEPADAVARQNQGRKQNN
jgi:hypothetical protein